MAALIPALAPLTQGAHHIGLAVSKLDESAAFFTRLLGWKEIRRDNSYPAIFVSDGSITVTLWQTKSDSPIGFNKNSNVGLHHAAFNVASEAQLNEIFTIIKNAEDVSIEFAPELLRNGPAKHMMCFEPSGIRIEFIWPGD